MDNEPVDVYIDVRRDERLYFILSQLSFLTDIAEELAKIRMRLEEK